MEISQEYVKRAAKEVLEVLKIWDVNSREDLEKKIDSSFSFDNSPGKIKLTCTPKNDYSIVYNTQGVNPIWEGIRGVGVPLELIIYLKKGYSYIFLKSQERIKGYTCFDRDYFYNLMQVNGLKTLELTKIKEELARICG